MNQRLRLGSIEFINSLPVDLGILNGAIRKPDLEVIQGSPVFLNEKILRGELDISPVSAFFYGQYQKKFLILPDVSISSRSGVQSVLLFSRRPIEDLGAAVIAVTGKGQSTPALLRILCKQRYGFEPVFLPLEASPIKIPECADAMLVIGDEALLASESPDLAGLFVTDLAEEWEDWTALPFVFAVWVVRREVFESSPEPVLRVWQTLLQSKRWALAHSAEVMAEAFRKTKLDPRSLEKYFSRLSYGFEPDLAEGMKLYLDLASRQGLLPEKRPETFEMIQKLTTV